MEDIARLAEIAHNALHEAGRRIPPPMDDYERAVWAETVRAILRAIREPTPKMLAAGTDWRKVTTGEMGGEPKAEWVWAAMIDALAPPPA